MPYLRLDMKKQGDSFDTFALVNRIEGIALDCSALSLPDRFSKL